jgi:DNA invertase Pin-like site-specific DNA recombinase
MDHEGEEVTKTSPDPAIIPFARTSKRFRRAEERREREAGGTIPVGLYVRLSRNRDGTILGLERQETETLPWAALKGYEVVRRYADDDTSAFRLKQKREGFEALLTDLGTGFIKGVVVWKLDRLVRRTLDWNRVLPQAEDTPWFVASFADGVNTADPMGRLLAGILVQMAELEAANIRTRTVAKHQELAKAGKWSGGGNRAYGHTANRRETVPEEVLAIKEVADRVIVGEPLRSIASDLSSRAVVGPDTKRGPGRPMAATVWRRILLSPRMVGARMDIDGRLSRERGMAPILDDETNRRVWRILNRPSGSAHFATENGPGNARRHLLTGFLVCSLCGAALKPWATHGKTAFACLKVPARPGCGKVSIIAEPVEAVVVEAALRYLERIDLTKHVQTDDAESEQILASIHREEAKLEDLAIQRFDANAIGDTEFRAARLPILRRREDLIARLNRRTPRLPLASGADVRRAWNAWSLHERRAALSVAIERVVVLPALVARTPDQDGAYAKGRPHRRLRPTERLKIDLRRL